MPTDALHIASFLVHVQPAHRDEITEWLATEPGCELRAEDPAGKLVVVMESRREARILEVIDSLQSHPAVLGAALVYHQLLDPDTADEPEEAPIP
ncbi:chaperone NapD [Halomonas sp. C05BenzN]|uniref:chaperone NapD n=1 Tax=Halomonas sp. C05BenzN TaxID=3411041 RepID=UPI003B92E26B